MSFSREMVIRDPEWARSLADYAVAVLEGRGFRTHRRNMRRYVLNVCRVLRRSGFGRLANRVELKAEEVGLL